MMSYVHQVRSFCSTFSVGKNLSNCLVALFEIHGTISPPENVFHAKLSGEFHYKISLGNGKVRLDL